MKFDVETYSCFYSSPQDLPEPDNEEIDNLILIANLTGPQEVRVRIKTGDAMEVPQVRFVGLHFCIFSLENESNKFVSTC